MRYLTLTILFLFSLILQSAVFSHLTIFGVKPDLVLVVIILYAIMNGSKEGALAGIIGGIIQDLAFGQYLGMNILTKVITGYLCGLLERRIYKENLLIPMIVILIGTLLNEFMLFLFRLMVDISTSSFVNVKEIILITAFYNSIVTLFIYKRFYASSQKGLLKVSDM